MRCTQLFCSANYEIIITFREKLVGFFYLFYLFPLNKNQLFFDVLIGQKQKQKEKVVKNIAPQK